MWALLFPSAVPPVASSASHQGGSIAVLLDGRSLLEIKRGRKKRELCICLSGPCWARRTGTGSFIPFCGETNSGAQQLFPARVTSCLSDRLKFLGSILPLRLLSLQTGLPTSGISKSSGLFSFPCPLGSGKYASYLPRGEAFDKGGEACSWLPWLPSFTASTPWGSLLPPQRKLLLTGV